MCIFYKIMLIRITGNKKAAPNMQTGGSFLLLFFCIGRCVGGFFRFRHFDIPYSFDYFGIGHTLCTQNVYKVNHFSSGHFIHRFLNLFVTFIIND